MQNINGEFFYGSDIKIHIATTIKDRDKAGMHLFNPTEWEIDDAVNNGHKIIFIHTILTWPIRNFKQGRKK